MLRTEHEYIGDLFLALPEPFSVVIEEVPTEAPRCSKFVPDHIAAEHNADEFTGIATPFGSTQYDVPGNLVGVIDEFLS